MIVRCSATAADPVEAGAIRPAERYGPGWLGQRPARGRMRGPPHGVARLRDSATRLGPGGRWTGHRHGITRRGDTGMRVALARRLSGIGSVELGEQPVPIPAAGQVLVRVHDAGAGPWDVAFVSGGFPGVAVPFVPGQEVAGVVEAVGDGVQVRPGDRVYASL